MRGLTLVATGHAVPQNCVTNQMLSECVETSDEWIRTRTGIAQRYFCNDKENTTSLALAAAQQAISNSGISPSQIGCVVCATLSSNTATPSIACQLQAALGLSEAIPALDVNAACSGFLYGIAVAQGLLSLAQTQHTSGGNYVLVIGVETLSKLLDMQDRNTCVLFGDGAGAAIFALEETNADQFAITMGARGSDAIFCGGLGQQTQTIQMDGKAVFRFAVEAVPKTILEILKIANLTLAEVDWVVCHQANERIIDHCIKKLHADAGKFYKNMDRFGNTSAASIPIALSEMQQRGMLKNGQKVLCVGFGGGLSWAGALVTVQEDKVK